MEKIFNRTVLFIVTLLLLSFASIHSLRAEEDAIDPELKNIGRLSLPEAEKQLDENIAEIERALAFLDKMGGMQIVLSSGGSDDEDEDVEEESDYSYTQPFSMLTSQALNHKLEETKSTLLNFEQNLYTTYSNINLKKYDFERILAEGLLPHEYNPVKYKITKLYFKDGSEIDNPVMTSGQNMDDDGFTSGSFTLAGNKPIDKIDVEIHYQSYPSYQKITLNKEQPEFKQNNSEHYRLINLNKKKATLQISIPKSKSYYIEGISASGKAIDSTGRNSQTSPSKQEIQAMTQYRDALVETKKNFKQFKTSQDLQTHLEKIAAEIQSSDNDIKNIQASVRFALTPQSVVIYLIDNKLNNVMSRQLTNRSSSQEFDIASDDNNEKLGLIDKNGKWVVQPQFSDIQYTELDNIYRIQTGSKAVSEDMRELIYQYFWLPPKTGKLEVLPFKNISKKINDELILVQRETNGPYGVYDISSRKFVIPMKFVNPKIMDNLFIASLGESTYNYESKYGAYTLQGKEILAPKYEQMEGIEGFIYAQNKNREVFNITGKKLTPNDYTAIGIFYGNQPLLIQNIKNNQYRFIDNTGKDLQFSLPYDKVEPFSNGMAIVTKNNKQGAINLSGKLTVPLVYDEVKTFQKNLAAAERRDVSPDERVVLIDKNNNVVKKLGTLYSSSVVQNGNEAEYDAFDQPRHGYHTVFDADGNVIKTYLWQQN